MGAKASKAGKKMDKGLERAERGVTIVGQFFDLFSGKGEGEVSACDQVRALFEQAPYADLRKTYDDSGTIQEAFANIGKEFPEQHGLDGFLAELTEDEAITLGACF